MKHEIFPLARLLALLNHSDLSEHADYVVRAVNAYGKIENVVATIAHKNKEDAIDYFLRAVNAHEELLEALKHASRLLAAIADDPEFPEWAESKKYIRQTLAKAEGK